MSLLRLDHNLQYVLRLTVDTVTSSLASLPVSSLDYIASACFQHQIGSEHRFVRPTYFATGPAATVGRH